MQQRSDTTVDDTCMVQTPSHDDYRDDRNDGCAGQSQKSFTTLHKTHQGQGNHNQDGHQVHAQPLGDKQYDGDPDNPQNQGNLQCEFRRLHNEFPILLSVDVCNL